jgi:hypothetical protein
MSVIIYVNEIEELSNIKEPLVFPDNITHYCLRKLLGNLCINLSYLNGSPVFLAEHEKIAEGTYYIDIWRPSDESCWEKVAQLLYCYVDEKYRTVRLGKQIEVRPNIFRVNSDPLTYWRRPHGQHYRWQCCSYQGKIHPLKHYIPEICDKTLLNEELTLTKARTCASSVAHLNHKNPIKIQVASLLQFKRLQSVTYPIVIKCWSEMKELLKLEYLQKAKFYISNISLINKFVKNYIESFHRSHAKFNFTFLTTDGFVVISNGYLSVYNIHFDFMTLNQINPIKKYVGSYLPRLDRLKNAEIVIND